jgi:hypothetical protein
LRRRRCNPDLGDDDFEIKVMKGTNYNFPNVKDADTYVKVEFPSPTVSADSRCLDLSVP